MYVTAVRSGEQNFGFVKVYGLLSRDNPEPCFGKFKESEVEKFLWDQEELNEFMGGKTYKVIF